MRQRRHQRKAAAAHPGRWLARVPVQSVLLLILLLGICLACPASWAGEPYPLFGSPLADTPVTTYASTPGERAPSSYAALPAWLAARARRPAVDMLGGEFWLVTRFSPGRPASGWVVTLANTWYEQATILVLGDDGSRQQFDARRDARTNLMPHGNAEVTLEPGRHYAIVIHVAAPFFTARPRIDVQTRSQYSRRTMNESALMLGALGLLGGLAVFILFVGLWIRDRSYVLYGCQALILMLGWSAFFGLPGEWLGIHTGRFNFTVWFIVLPIVHAPFTIRFLDLRQRAPRMARIGYAIAIAAAFALPLSLAFPSLAFLIATLAVVIVMSFSISAGVWALSHGVRRARFFTLAYTAVLVPGCIILPANLGLVSSVVDNADLLTLIGNGCEAMLLAFALADYVKLVEDGRERFRKGMQEAIAKASTDPLTGLGNRLAFNMMIERITAQTSPEPIQGNLQIAMIDLDGLKHVNDNLGHEYGDKLLRATGAGLARLAGERIQAFRLGGDEFALIGRGDELSLQRLTKSLVELDRTLREGGFPDAGISFGISGATQKHLGNAELTELVREADHIMYTHKSQRRTARTGAKPPL